LNLKLLKGDFDLAELLSLFFSEALLDRREASTRRVSTKQARYRMKRRLHEQYLTTILRTYGHAR